MKDSVNKVIKAPRHLFHYEPILVPEFDDLGHVVGHTCPTVVANDLKSIANLTAHNFPNELGVSIDPDDVTGYRRLIDMLNSSRNLHCSGIVSFGRDDASVMVAAQQAANSFNNN